MSYPLDDLTIVDWAQIFSAIGQCLSAAGALIAARYALQTVKEMQKQSEAERTKFNLEIDEFIASNGPALRIEWQDSNQDSPINSLNIFPLNAKAVSVMQDDKPNKSAFDSMSLWWNDPAPNSVPTKFVILNIHNTQTKSSGIAHSIRGVISTSVKKRKLGFPPHQDFDLVFEIEKCDPQDTISIPIRVEGMPAYYFSLNRIEYRCNYSERALNFITGERECVFESKS